MVKACKNGVTIIIPKQSYIADYQKFGWELIKDNKVASKEEIKEEVKEVVEEVKKEEIKNKQKK